MRPPLKHVFPVPQVLSPHVYMKQMVRKARAEKREKERMYGPTNTKPLIVSPNMREINMHFTGNRVE